MAKKFLTAIDARSYLDLNKNELRNAAIQNLATPPGTPANGQIYYDTDDNLLYYYDSATWQSLSTGATLSFGSPSALTVGGSNSDGVATSAARSDHVHSLPGWGSVTAETSFGGSSSNGVATTFARSDHTHGTPAAPTASSVGAVANGSGTPSIYTDTFANRPAAGTSGRLFVDTTNFLVYRDNGATWDQLYAFGASASTQAIGDSAAGGSAVTVSRSDHKHAMPSFGNVTAQTSYGASSGNGSASTIARSDHTHGTPSLTSNTPSTQAIGDTAVVGTGTAPAKDDHKHAMPSFGSVTSQTSFGAASSNGVSASIARTDHTHGTPTHDGAAHSAISISSLAAATATYSFGAQTVQSSAVPSGANDLTNKSYVDSIAAGLRDFKDSVRVATTTNGTLATAFANGQTVDGVTLATGNRILIKNQSTASENGIYIVQASGAPTRATDADASGEISVGTMVYVESGTANGGQQWVATATGATPWVPGSSTSTWALYFAITSTQAGAGLTASGNVIAVGAGTGITVNADDVAINTSVVARKYTTATHSSSTSVAITHNLGNQWVNAQAFEVATSALVECDITLTDANTVTFGFATAPSANSIRFVITG